MEENLLKEIIRTLLTGIAVKLSKENTNNCKFKYEYDDVILTCHLLFETENKKVETEEN